jgi:hypothetical protein
MFPSISEGKAGGTTRRPLVLHMDWGRILFPDSATVSNPGGLHMEVQHVGYQLDP